MIATASLLRDPQALLDGVARQERRWRRRARIEQLAPGTAGAANPRTDWTFWLYLAGRGTGKTRSGAEWVIEKARANPGCKINLVAPTYADAVKTMLSAGLEGIEGASGILAISPAEFRPEWQPSKGLLVWPNGSVAEVFSADAPERLRGPQCHFAWVDEIAAWAGLAPAWDQLLFGLRLGTSPQACITTTPRPVAIVRDLLKNPQSVVTRGSTFDNRANLAPGFFQGIIAKYEGTRLGRQELHAEMLEDTPGALWTGDMIERLRVRESPSLKRVVVAIDPAVSTNEGSDETGIIVFGVGACGCKSNGHAIVEDHGFVLADLSGKHSPNAWARIVVDAMREWKADRAVAEVNNGGDLVEENLRTVDRNIAYTPVHASRGKRPRAEPVAALYEQGKVHHVGGFAKLEDQMTGWEAMGKERSPDHMDALVWAVADTMLQEAETESELVMRATWGR